MIRLHLLPTLTGGTRDTSRWQRLAMVVLAFGAYAYALACVPDPIRFTQDEANCATQAWALWDHGVWPAHGPEVHGSVFHLGVGFYVLLAWAAGLTGSLHAAIRVLLVGHALAVLVWGMGAATLVGWRRAFVMAALVCASPLFFGSIDAPLVHQPYGQLFAAVAMVGAMRFAATGERLAWGLATIGAALVLHFHLSWWPVAVVVADAVWVRRGDLPRFGLLFTLVVLLGLNPELLKVLWQHDLAQIRAAMASPTPGSGFTLSDFVRSAADATPGGAATWVLGLGWGVASVRRRDQDPGRAVVARATLVHLGACTALWWVTREGWLSYCTFSMLPTTVGLTWLAVDLIGVTVGRLAPGAAWVATTAAVLGAVAFLPTGMGRVYQPAPVVPFRDLDAMTALDDLLRRDPSVTQDDLRGLGKRVHGVLCVEGAIQPCRFDVFLQRWPLHGPPSPTGPLLVRFEGRTPHVEPMPDCLVRVGDGWRATCATPVALHVVVDVDGPHATLGPSVVPPEVIEVSLDGAAVPLHLIPGMPTGTLNTVFVFAADATPLAGELHVRVAQAGVRILDVFVAPRAYELRDFGMDGRVP